MRPTVRLRLTAWYASIFLVGGAVLLAFSYLIVSRNTSSFPIRVKEQLAARGSALAILPGGKVEIPPPPVGATKVLPPGGSPRLTLLSGPDQRLLRRLEQQRHLAEQKVSGDLHRRTAIDFALALLGTTLVSLLAGWIAAGRALRPVARITAAARRVAAEGDLAERIALDGPADELRELADTFDAMLERLDRAFASQRSFVANASHELRTPLAIMRAEIEERLDDPSVSKDELMQMAAVVRDAVDRSEALIAGLLMLARGQVDLRKDESIELAELARTVAARSEPEAVARGVDIETLGAPVYCRGDRELLERLVVNLVENALRYNEVGGFIRLEIEENEHGATLRVSNGGKAVPGEAVPHLFEPFYRVEQSRSRESGGAGLGLSIVAAVAAAHGGTAAASIRDTGGLIVTVTLPPESTPSGGAGQLPAGELTASPHAEANAVL